MIDHLIFLTGITAIAFVLFQVGEQALKRSPSRSPFHVWLNYSIVFGVLATACLWCGHEVRPGVVIDARGAVVAVATIVEGPWVGLSTAGIMAINRAFLGGDGMWAGISGIALDYLVSVLLALLWQKRRGDWTGQLTLLSLCGVAVGGIEAWSLSWIGKPGVGQALLHAAGWELFITQLVCTVLLGSLIGLQRERQRSQEVFQNALTTSMDGFAQFGRDGRLMECNRMLEAMTGYSRKELLGMNLAQLKVGMSPEQMQPWLADLRRRGSYRFEARWRRKDGGEMDLAAAAAASPKALDEIFVFFHDITQRKAWEEELQTSRNQLQSLLDNLPDPAWLKDPSGRYLAVNMRWCEFFSQEREKVLGRMAADFLPAEIARKWEQQERELVASRQPVRMEVTQALEGGEQRWHEVWMSGIYDAAGIPKGTLGISRDITAHQKAEDRLRKLNRALQATSACGKVLVRATYEQEFLNQVCRILVEHGGYRMAWVGYLEHNEAKTVRPVAQAGFDEGYLADANISWADAERGRGPTGTCIRTRQTFVARGIAANPAMAPWRENALKRGYAAMAALPLMNGDLIYGALTVYATTSEAFDEDEVGLLTELADDLAFGITTLRTRATLEKRLRYQHALTAISVILKKSNPVSQGITQVLEVLRSASEMDRVYIFENHADPERGLCMSQTQECIKAGVSPQLNNPNLQDLPYREVSPSGFLLQRFLRREPCRGPVSQWPPEERLIMESQGIQDTLILPIFAGKEFWGFLGFDDCTTIDRFDNDDVALLQNAADLIGWHVAAARDTAALAESQRSLSTLMANLPGMVYHRRNDARWTMEFVSEGCLALTGHAPADLIQNSRYNYTDLIFPDDVESARKQIQAGIEQRRQYQLSYRIRTAAGETKWVWEQGLGFRDKKGELQALEGFIIDVTPQKSAEAMLTKFQLLSDHAQDIILFVRPEDGRIVEANRAACEAYGYNRAELLAMRIHDLRAVESRDRIDRQIAQSVGSGLLFETVHVRRDGRTFPIEVSSREAMIAGERLLLNLARDITERKLAEEARREGERRYRLLADNTEDFVTLFDAQWRRIYNCPSYYRRTGWTEADLEATSWRTRVHPDDIPAVEKGRALVESGSPATYEHRIRRRDGTWIWVEAFAKPLAGRQGQPPQYLTVAHDITERKQAELALLRLNAELEERVRERTAEALELYNNAPCGYHALGPDGMVTQMNDTELAWLGRPREEVEGRMFLADLMTPECAERFDESYPEFVRNGTISSQQWDLRQKNGGVMAVLATSEAVRDAEGRFVKCRTTTIDITTLRHATLKLRKLSQAVEYSPSMILITDEKGRVEYVNPTWEDVTGYRLEDVIGRRLRMLKSGVHSIEFYAHLWKEITAGRIWRGEFCNRKKSGELYWESAAIAPVFNEAGIITHYVAVKEDITARRKAAEELRLAKEEADSANRAKSVFLANMSHEIRTPMNAILGFSQLLLRESGLSAMNRQQLTSIQRSGEHLMDIINDILEMARIESASVRLNPTPFDLFQLVEELEQMFHQRAREKQLVFLVERQAGVPRQIKADQTKLRQVFINLLSNAVKFTGAGGQITLRLRAADEPDGMVRLNAEVEDTGSGISPEDIPHLFEPFFQTSTGKQVPGGTGLGLPISREFAHLMGGDITVSSRPGFGSTFRFDARVARAERVTDPADAGEARRVLRLQAGTPACRVLAVDDTQENRELLEQLLAPVGFEVRTAKDGADAVALCREWLPNVVLLDLRMPVMDGYEAARQIRAAYGRAVKIVALTASVFSQDQNRALAEGADAFLGKPFQDQDLFECIRKLTGVDYVYAESPTEPSHQASAVIQPPSREAVRQLPADLLETFREALWQADYDQMVTLTGKICERDETLGHQLRQLVKSFDYGTLQNLLSEDAPGR